MTTGQTVDLIVTLFVAALFSVIAFLLKGRFDEQDKSLAEIRNDVKTLQDSSIANGLSIARLIESQRNVVSNQTLLSRTQERLISEADDLQDVNDQLQDATKSLRLKWEAHLQYHRDMQKNREEREHHGQ